MKNLYRLTQEEQNVLCIIIQLLFIYCSAIKSEDTSCSVVQGAPSPIPPLVIGLTKGTLSAHPHPG